MTEETKRERSAPARAPESDMVYEGGGSFPLAQAKGPPPETFRKVRGALEETCRVIDASADGLAELTNRTQLGVRDRLMLETLMRVRRETGAQLWSALASQKDRHNETWTQAAPVFAACPDLVERIAQAPSAAAAYEVVSESDAELEKVLETMSGASSAARPLLEEVRNIVAQLGRSSRTVVLGADDM